MSLFDCTSMHSISPGYKQVRKTPSGKDSFLPLLGGWRLMVSAGCWGLFLLVLTFSSLWVTRVIIKTYTDYSSNESLRRNSRFSQTSELLQESLCVLIVHEPLFPPLMQTPTSRLKLISLWTRYSCPNLKYISLMDVNSCFSKSVNCFNHIAYVYWLCIEVASTPPYRILQIFGNNHDTNGTFKWQPEPVGRGAWNILSTCFINNVLVHLDRGASECTASRNGFLRKAGWLILGLIAPELVVFTA